MSSFNNPKTLFMNTQQRVVYYFKNWLRGKQEESHYGKSMGLTSIMIEIRIHLLDYKNEYIQSLQYTQRH